MSVPIEPEGQIAATKLTVTVWLRNDHRVPWRSFGSPTPTSSLGSPDYQKYLREPHRLVVGDGAEHSGRRHKPNVWLRESVPGGRSGREARQ